MKMILILFALLKFEAMKHTGEIIQTDTHEGRGTYTITIEGKKIEHAYKEEIVNYLVTHKFTYNEDLTLFNK